MSETKSEMLNSGETCRRKEMARKKVLYFLMKKFFIVTIKKPFLLVDNCLNF